MGAVVKAKVGTLEDEVREGFSRWLREDFIDMVQGLSGKRRLLVRFWDGCEKDLTLNQLTVVTVERIPMTEEYEVPMISAIPCETIDL